MSDLNDILIRPNAQEIQHLVALSAAAYGSEYYIKNFNYLSILTDGAINPLNTRKDIATANSVCSIKFNDGLEHIINCEKQNIDIRDKRFFKYYNELGGNQAEGEALQSGFGNLYFILHNNWIRYEMQKSHPYYNDIFEVAAMENQVVWLGVEKLNILYTAGINYIPMGVFSQIGLIWSSTIPAGRFTIEIIELQHKHQDIADGQVIFSSAVLESRQNENIYSDRLAIRVTNADAAVVGEINLQVMLDG